MAYDNDLLKRRNSHDKLTIEMVRHGKRQRAARVVVSPDRRIVEALEKLGLWGAFEKIAMAVAIRTAGLGSPAYDMSRVRGCGFNLEYGVELLMKYNRWAALCRERRYFIGIVFDMIIGGLSFRALDRKYRVRAGSARGGFFGALGLWRE